MTALRPSKIIGIGRNYVDHAKELGNPMPAVPIIFFKPPTSLIGDGDTILLPGVSQRVEFEAEIGVVIGRRTRNRSPGEGRARRSADSPASTTSPAATCRRWTASGAGPRDSTRSVRSVPGWRRASTGASLELICRVNGERAPARPRDRHAFFDSGAGVVRQRHHDSGAGRPDRHRHAGRDGRRWPTETSWKSRFPVSAFSRNPVRNGETR